MAVQINKMDSKIKLKYKVGVDEDGNDIFRTKTYSRIKNSVADDDIFAVVSAISNLQKYPLAKLIRVEEKEITGE
ncbi:Protein of unknown function [Caminicella sporogenes DSM 14501]|uniref:DUF1659 domain-containing protein n=1 Tax=Caminicella sporogenes DSM 14501 TaxID=1121266 RepID=A0A1M6SVG4_9FIRM|nr:DUF1659 domain-containing protein [Caminicella sporogenes]RKD21910.1 hypothetical protein BET04_06560 [Caminicella sporogenes]WIF96120.1 DUF1659 domain-containing protein [Caminicella sporogenes]SHK48630.1 Protein of unknown function [Caminicella sporogenes DSM 14501]